MKRCVCEGPVPFSDFEMAGRCTKEYEIFQAEFDKLVNSVGSIVEKLAAKAFSNFLIDRSNFERARNSAYDTDNRAACLLDVIHRKIEEKPSCFHVFVEILREIPYCKEKADDLEAKFRAGILRGRFVFANFAWNLQSSLS